MAENEWKKPAAPPPPLFFGKKERDLVKQVNDELIEKVIGQQILYYPISLEHTDFHPIYGEALHKSFLAPIRVYALVAVPSGVRRNRQTNLKLIRSGAGRGIRTPNTRLTRTALYR